LLNVFCNKHENQLRNKILEYDVTSININTTKQNRITTKNIHKERAQEKQLGEKAATLKTPMFTGGETGLSEDHWPMRFVNIVLRLWNIIVDVWGGLFSKHV
jgi:hypothetical protein